MSSPYLVSSGNIPKFKRVVRKIWKTTKGPAKIIVIVTNKIFVWCKQKIVEVKNNGTLRANPSLKY